MRRKLFDILTLLLVVSIHAPGRGATHKLLLPFPLLKVSIHAPGRGATAVQRIVILGVDLVSIHAPGRGATLHCSNI